MAWPTHVAILCLAACTSFESEYEKGVYGYEPLYCYQTLGGVDCHRQPHHRDEARLVNYYGPAPSKYKPPKPPEENRLRPPPKGSTAAYQGSEPRASMGNTASVQTDADDGSGPGGKGKAAAEEKPEWKEWLPLVSMAFGALQVVAAFAL